MKHIFIISLILTGCGVTGSTYSPYPCHGSYCSTTQVDAGVDAAKDH